MQNTAVTVIGKLRAEVRIIEESGLEKEAEVILRGNFRYRKRLYKDIILVSLTLVEDTGLHHTLDSFTNHLPYLKPVRAFRIFLMAELERILEEYQDKPGSIIHRGLFSYVWELQSFNEVQSVIRQAKTEVGKLGGAKKYPSHPGPLSEEEKALKILNVLRVRPSTNRVFRVASA